MSEKRENERFRSDLFVSAASGSNVYICEVLDISISGMKLLFKDNFEGKNFELSFSFDETFISIPAVVRWQDSVDSKIVGVKFTQGLRAQETYNLLEYVRKNEIK